MTRAIRPSTPADALAIIALLREAGLSSNVEPEHLQWKYWQERHDWSGSRSFVLTEDNEVIAHGAIIPAWCLWNSQRIRMIHVIDWAARPSALGAGAILMRYFGAQAQALLAIGGSEQTLKILPRMGFRPAGSATGYVRPLHSLRLLRGVTQPSWRLLLRVARSAAWALAAPRGRHADWQVRRIGLDEVGQIAHAVPKSDYGMSVLERTTEAFRYMLNTPIVQMHLHAMERAGVIRGYFLLAAAPGQVRIADCWMDSRDSSDWGDMIQCAVAQAKHDPQAAEIVIQASDALLTEALRACGFHARGVTPVQIRMAPGIATPPAPLRVQMLDNDAAYLHEGRREFWA